MRQVHVAGPEGTVLGEQIEVFERVYELCGQRASDFMLTRSGNLLVAALEPTAELIVNGQPYKADPAPMPATREWQPDGWHLVAGSLVQSFGPPTG